MKHKKLSALVLFLAAVLLFMILLTEGKELILRRHQIMMASAGAVVRFQDSLSCGSGAAECGSLASHAADSCIMEPETPVRLQYDRYPLSLVYFVTGEDGTPIYAMPDTGAEQIRRSEAREKLGYAETVWVADGRIENIQMGSGENSAGQTVWYRVYWYETAEGCVTPDGSLEGAEKVFGFIPEGGAEKRRVRLDAMAEYIKKADSFVSAGAVTHVSNYKNGNGRPPAYHGQNADAAGTPRSQSAPAYPELENKEEFSYLEDGTLLLILDAAVDASGNSGEGAGAPAYRRVMDLRDGRPYFVPLKYVPSQESLHALTKAVVVDRKNQNEAAFEKLDGVWTCVSYTMATTGADNAYAAPTPLGYFLMIERRPQFYYYKDGTTEVQGYAPYVMRFCGGAYIHGVPVSYGDRNGKRIKPGIREYSSTMGTIPLSHKCVRNYTSHARFLYDWYEAGQTAVIVIE